MLISHKPPLYKHTFVIILVNMWNNVQFSSVAQSCPTLRPHESQHARPPCPSPSPGVQSDSGPLSPWCHPAIPVIGSEITMKIGLLSSHCQALRRKRRLVAWHFAKYLTFISWAVVETGSCLAWLQSPSLASLYCISCFYQLCLIWSKLNFNIRNEMYYFGF